MRMFGLIICGYLTYLIVTTPSDSGAGVLLKAAVIYFIWIINGSIGNYFGSMADTIWLLIIIMLLIVFAVFLSVGDKEPEEKVDKQADDEDKRS